MGRGFRFEQLRTNGVDFSTYEFEVKKIQFTLQIWDVNHSGTYASSRNRFYRGSYGGIICYDIHNRYSFKQTTSWIEELWTRSQRGVVPIILLAISEGQKQDDAIPKDKGRNYAEVLTEKMGQFGFKVKYYETSVSTGTNIGTVLVELGLQINLGLQRGQLKLQ